MGEIELYQEQVLATVASASLLAPEELASLRSIAPEIQDVWQKQQTWRTKTEAWLCVLQGIKHPTKASQYWQSVREMAVFVDQLVHLSYDYQVKTGELEVLLAEADELDELASTATSTATQRKLTLQASIKRIEAKRADYVLKDMRRAGHHRHREILMWKGIMDELDDGTFDTTDPDTHQLESYQKQFAMEAQLALKSNAGPAELRNALGKSITATKALEDNLLEITNEQT